MKQFIIRNRYFLFPQLLFLIIAGILLIVYPKVELHIFINKLHTSWLDSFFRFVTNLGLGYIYIPVILVLLNKKVKWSLVYLHAVLYSNLILLFFKQVLLENSYRPSWYFYLYENYQLHLVDGVQLHQLNSFPSGHTTTAFTVFFTLAILCRTDLAKLMLFGYAFLTAFSRVYLSQHFLVDIFAGSILGTGIVFLSYFIVTSHEKAWMRIILWHYLIPKKKRQAIFDNNC